MILNFVTLFNSAYLSRGLVLYHSLKEKCRGFHLYVVAFDDITYDYFLENPQQHLTVIPLAQFEDEKLKAVKPSRSAAEYCWTCTASTILFCLDNFQLQNCTYIDADMCFYSDPAVLIEEMGDHSVLITDHRYTKKYDQSSGSGKYCVQFISFKNTVDGRLVLNWWRDACIEWCYNRIEDGKFGDQKYLDDWTKRFKGVHELKHLGGGVAPWNVQQYKFRKKAGTIVGEEKTTGNNFNLIFYHYHSLRFFERDLLVYCDTDYDLGSDVKKLLYRDYVKKLLEQYKIVVNKHPEVNANGVFGPSWYEPMGMRTVMQYYRENISSSRRNVVGLKLPRQIRNHYYYHFSQFK